MILKLLMRLKAHQIAFENIAFIVKELYFQGAGIGTIGRKLAKLPKHLMKSQYSVTFSLRGLKKAAETIDILIEHGMPFSVELT